MGKITDTVKHLILINVVFWIGALTIQEGRMFNDLFNYHFPLNSMFRPWQIVTHMFMHANYVPTPQGGTTIYFQHILFNMFGLYMFGTPVEEFLGKKKFIFFYFSAGLGGLLIHGGWDYIQFSSILNEVVNIGGLGKQEVLNILDTGNYDKLPDGVFTQKKWDVFSQSYYGTLAGASGALMGVLAGFAMAFPDHKLMMIFFPVPIKAKYFIPGIIALDLFSAITGISIFSPSNTAFLAHVGGALIGFILMWYWKKNSFNKNRWDQ